MNEVHTLFPKLKWREKMHYYLVLRESEQNVIDPWAELSLYNCDITY
jgi:hypothetical protein